MKGAIVATMQGMAELGSAVPGNRLSLALSTVWSYLAGTFVETTGLGRPTGEKRARLEVLVHGGEPD